MNAKSDSTVAGITSVARFLVETLKLLESKAPPPAKCHHAITYARYGSDESGWDDKLALQVNQGGVFQCLFLDEEDFTKSPSALVAEIVQVLSECQKPHEPNFDERRGGEVKSTPESE